jgi:hypothetical protein
MKTGKNRDQESVKLNTTWQVARPKLLIAGSLLEWRAWSWRSHGEFVP